MQAPEILRKSRTMAQQPPAAEASTKRYDVEMIRDFLDQLRLEVRLRMLENTEEPGEKHPELLAELLKKWQ